MEVSKVKIQRISKTDVQTLGILTVFDKYGFPFWECRTLELPWLDNQKRKSCIPEGVYPVVKRYSAKFKDHFHIKEVPNRDYILIHPVNFVKDLLGCIGAGLSHTDIDGDGHRDLTRSKKTLKDLNRILPDSFELEIYV